MITQLLTPKGNNEVKTKIEDLSGDNNEENNGEADQESEEEEMDWYFEQVYTLVLLGGREHCCEIYST